MNAVENDVENLIAKELKSANEKFSQFNSPHEGYAVILEEVEELELETEKIKNYIKCLWEAIKSDDDLSVVDFAISNLRMHAIFAVCEAIQVAAMCDKFKNLQKGEEK